MHRLILIAFFASFLGSTLLLAIDELRWGGSGYDSALENSSRFIALLDIYNKDEEMIEVWVDSQETVKEVGLMQLITSDGQEISSVQCRKAMRHITAPWACSFHIDDIKQLSGQGKIIVKNRSGDTLIKDGVDLDKLSSFATNLSKEQ